jgi:hypothetical protein
VGRGHTVSLAWWDVFRVFRILEHW